MSIYNNIFHYYRGQTRNGSEERKLLQIENNTTKAFINVLQHSSPLLTKNFIEWLGFKGNGENSFEYMYQVTNELHRKTPQAIVIGIAETDNIINNLQDKKYSIPDGAILSDSVSILLETKIGLKSYIEINQIEGHKKRFAVDQNVEENIVVTWNKIRVFYLEQLQQFRKTKETLTCFLLEQFEEFCVINCIGSAKTNEYSFLQFEKVKAQKLARKIHNYIWEEAGYKDVQDAGTRDGIGYKRIGKPKFATLSIQRQRHFILHIGKKEQRLGLSIQNEIDNVIGRKFDRQRHDEERYPHETYIRLEWVDNFEQIRSFIDLAYKLR
ncbi:hypothetical protein VBD025_02915 [Virgibacillus flavescens]|uniref:hypothetical protein n=1 Tax=Virgibacillus flavescens TaxID=1611422 RepID=UPI003D338EF2